MNLRINLIKKTKKVYRLEHILPVWSCQPYTSNGRFYRIDICRLFALQKKLRTGRCAFCDQAILWILFTCKNVFGNCFQYFFFKRKWHAFERENWMKEVQEKLTKNFSAGLEKETKQTAFISSLKNIPKKRPEQKSNWHSEVEGSISNLFPRWLGWRWWSLRCTWMWQIWKSWTNTTTPYRRN